MSTAPRSKSTTTHAPIPPLSSDPFNAYTQLESFRSRVVELEALIHAVAERDPPACDDNDVRKDVMRILSLAETAHVRVAALLDEIDGVLADALLFAETDADKTPVPSGDE